MKPRVHWVPAFGCFTACGTTKYAEASEIGNEVTCLRCRKHLRRPVDQTPNPRHVTPTGTPGGHEEGET